MPSRQQVEALLAHDSEDVFLNYALACITVSEGDFAGAVRGFDRVLELDADYVPAHFQKGQALTKADDVPAARAALEIGIAVARRVGDTHAVGEMTEFLAMLPTD